MLTYCAPWSQRADKLKVELQEVGKVFYQQTATATPPPEPPPDAAEQRGGRVIDAEHAETGGA